MKQITADLWLKAAAIFCILAGSVTLAMGVWWLLWSLWTFVLPQVWPTGPEGLIRPGYWLFAGMWTLFVLITWVIKRKV